MQKKLWIATLFMVAAAGLFLVKPRPVKAQSGCDATSLSGAFGYALTGAVYDQSGNLYYLAANGRLSADGNGALTGADTLSLDGSIVKRKYTGTYTLNSDCTGSAQLQISDGTSLGKGANLDLVVADSGKQVNLIQTDGSFVFSGTGRKQ